MNMDILKLSGHEEATEKILELVEQLKKARSLANDLADIKMTIQDTRKKEINEYIKEIRDDFNKTFGYEPSQLYLVAEGNSHSIRTILNGT